jgi:hypothetical protein
MDRSAVDAHIKMGAGLGPYIYHLPLVIAPISSNRLLTKWAVSARVVDFMVAAVYSLLEC